MRGLVLLVLLSGSLAGCLDANPVESPLPPAQDMRVDVAGALEAEGRTKAPDGPMRGNLTLSYHNPETAERLVIVMRAGEVLDGLARPVDGYFIEVHHDVPGDDRSRVLRVGTDACRVPLWEYYADPDGVWFADRGQMSGHPLRGLPGFLYLPAIPPGGLPDGRGSEQDAFGSGGSWDEVWDAWQQWPIGDGVLAAADYGDYTATELLDASQPGRYGRLGAWEFDGDGISIPEQVRAPWARHDWMPLVAYRNEGAPLPRCDGLPAPEAVPALPLTDRATAEDPPVTWSMQEAIALAEGDATLVNLQAVKAAAYIMRWSYQDTEPLLLSAMPVEEIWRFTYVVPGSTNLLHVTCSREAVAGVLPVEGCDEQAQLGQDAAPSRPEGTIADYAALFEGHARLLGETPRSLDMVLHEGRDGEARVMAWTQYPGDLLWDAADGRLVSVQDHAASFARPFV